MNNLSLLGSVTRAIKVRQHMSSPPISLLGIPTCLLYYVLIFFFKGAFMLSTNYDLTKESSASFRLMLSVMSKWLSSERNINVRIGDEMSVWRR